MSGVCKGLNGYSPHNVRHDIESKITTWYMYNNEKHYVETLINHSEQILY